MEYRNLDKQKHGVGWNNGKKRKRKKRRVNVASLQETKCKENKGAYWYLQTLLHMKKNMPKME